MSANPPVDVQAHGQSIWYDNIRRGLLESGELQALIENYGVLGVTSNPAIFGIYYMAMFVLMVINCINGVFLLRSRLLNY